MSLSIGAVASDFEAETAESPNWNPADNVTIAGSVSDEEAKTIYPDGWDAPRPYLRIMPQPK